MYIWRIYLKISRIYYNSILNSFSYLRERDCTQLKLKLFNYYYSAALFYFIYPEEKNIFRALELTDFNDIKVVILWQDPYHQKGQAHWLSFSVQDWIKVPPSLRNIYKEIESCIWKVEDSKPASHSKIWWERFTDSIIKKISDEKENVVFLLWWWFAKSKAKLNSFL